ncbi:hypothetical protein BFG07_06555 [Kosakonia cowanii]|uniref:hypothetical protein n=1 Tax=Kosakonia cowanii TaxID=208223 RepID=UPI000B9726FF|nr:hypothetical protein [Kosakonia cowanii]AST68361.1 hypothetical protein BFG07_06555 [Kosakonia cowanii]
MKKFICALSLYFLAVGYCCAAFQEREYNIWYEKDGVLYDVTQTSDGTPVMISISQSGFKTANMVISYESVGACAKSTPPLDVNGDVISAEYACSQYGNDKIEHYIVRDAARVNALVEHLKSDFTVVIQGSIKIWAANIKTPNYGMSPKF